MAQASTTNPADFANRRQLYFSTELLKELEFNLRMAQFAEKKTAPASGLLAIQFFRVRKARRPSDQPGGQGPAQLTEGVQNLRKTEVSVGKLISYLIQVGDDFEISDVVRATDVLDTLKIYMKTLGADAAVNIDTIIARSCLADLTSNAKAAAALCSTQAQTTLFNSNATYGRAGAKYFERFAGLANTGNSASDFATFIAAAAANSKFTRLEHLRALTQLRSNDIHPKDGEVYPVICPPQVMFDIRQDGTLVSAMTQRDNNKLYKYEQFELDGGAFIESTNPWIESAGTYGTYNDAGAKLSYSLLYLGDDPFGISKISNNIAGGDPTAPKITILDSPDKSDRYNQIVAGSYKLYFGAIMKLTDDASDMPHLCVLRCQSSFV